MSFLAAAFIATSAYSAWQDLEAGKAEASAHRAASQAKRRQAQKLLERAKMNAGFSRMEGDVVKGSQREAFASSNIDLGSGIVLSTLADTARRVERQIEIDNITAQADANSILMGADLDMQRAGIAQTTAKNKAVSGLIQTGFMMSK